MSTARDLIKGSLQLIGAYGIGENPSAEDAADCLAVMQRMLGSWSTEDLTIFTQARESFPLVGGKASYTMGLDVLADFNTARPMNLNDVRVEIVGSNPRLEVPVRIVNDHEWANVLQKATPGTFPTVLHAQGSYPLETFDVWPVPTVGNNLIIYSDKPLATIASVSTVIALPMGYEDAIVTNLAVKLAPIFGRAVSPDLMQQAMESKGNIKRQNIKPTYLECDSALLGSRGAFNWMTGE